MISLLLLAALADDGRPVFALERAHAGSTWVLADGRLSRDGMPVAEEVVGEPAFGGALAVVARVVEPPVGTALFAVDGDERRELVGLAWRPDRPAVSPDGRHVAFVSGRSGLSSVWLLEVESGRVRQLTNVGVAPQKGGRPPGFVPPPHEGPPRFEGGELVWSSPDGPVRVAWR